MLTQNSQSMAAEGAGDGRIFNFSAGPGALPLPVLQQAQAALLNYDGTGMSVMEMSHRSQAFDGILERAYTDLRALLNLPDDYHVLFLQGGATLQFAMLPLNLLPQDASADYIITGNWAQAAFKEARRLGRSVRAAGSSECDGFSYMPDQASLDLDPQAAYLHFTSNETIHGVEWPAEPVPPDGVPLVVDISSDFLSRPIDVTRYGLLYAGAQKNLGPAGVTLVIVRNSLLERVPAGLPLMLDYRLQAEQKSLYNTPPVWSIYMVGLVLRWLRDQGGLAEVEQRNIAKAAHVYQAIDESGGFYRGHARPDHRSRMNITFRLPDEALEKQFLKQAEARGLSGLKGHRALGGLRASVYNAFPAAGAEALAQFMREFQRAQG
jgi:phosphoserine aminotransferase